MKPTEVEAASLDEPPAPTRDEPQAHYELTGPELWEQTGGEIDALVIAVGTGGTISGTGRYLKEQKPELLIVGADPEGSIYSGGPVHPYLVEGIGELVTNDPSHGPALAEYADEAWAAADRPTSPVRRASRRRPSRSRSTALSGCRPRPRSGSARWPRGIHSSSRR